METEALWVNSFYHRRRPLSLLSRYPPSAFGLTYPPRDSARSTDVLDLQLMRPWLLPCIGTSLERPFQLARVFSGTLRNTIREDRTISPANIMGSEGILAIAKLSGSSRGLQHSIRCIMKVARKALEKTNKRPRQIVG